MEPPILESVVGDTTAGAVESPSTSPVADIVVDIVGRIDGRTGRCQLMQDVRDLTGRIIGYPPANSLLITVDT